MKKKEKVEEKEEGAATKGEGEKRRGLWCEERLGFYKKINLHN